MNEKSAMLLRDIAKLGYPMLEVSEDLNANQVLADIVKSNDPRFWESFPIVLSSAAEDFEFEPQKVEMQLETRNQKENLSNLLLLSGAIFQEYKITPYWWKKRKKKLSNEEQRLLQTFKISIRQNQEIHWKKTSLDTERLKRNFELYFGNRASRSEHQQARQEEMSAEIAMSRLFSPKQKELFKRKLSGLPLNKTEQEYFSRVVKKKTQALANEQLHRMAKTLLKQF